MDTTQIHTAYDRHDESPILSGDALDPFMDEHDIEYWLWDGERLIPASAEESERLREREALLRLGYWESQSEGITLAQRTQWHGMIRAVQSTLGRLLAYISNSSSRTS